MAKKKKKENFKFSFADLVDGINERYGPSTCVLASDAESLQADYWIETGMPVFDSALGGGVPLSRYVTIQGDPQSGKSLIALKILSAFQRFCRINLRPIYSWNEATQEKISLPWLQTVKKFEPMRCVWLDVENCFSKGWAAKFGVDSRGVHIVRPEYAEQAIDIIENFIATGECDLIVIDSVAAMAPSVEIESSAEDSQYASLAKLLSKAMRVWTAVGNAGSLSRTHSTTLVIINQYRTGFGQHGSYRTSPGGRALAYYSDIILDVKKLGFLAAENGLTVGHSLEIVTSKNKFAPPNRGGKIDIATVSTPACVAGASDFSAQLVCLAEFWGFVRKAGSWYHLSKELKVQGTTEAGRALNKPENKKLRDALQKAVMKKELQYRTEGLV